MIRILINFIKKLIMIIVGIILFFTLINVINVFIVYPYQLKTEVIDRYKAKNILLKRNDMRTGHYSRFLNIFCEGYPTTWFEIVNPKQFENPLFNIGHNRYGSYPVSTQCTSSFWYPDIVTKGQINYVIMDLINDKSKGNDFSKIEEIVNKKKEEIIEKGFYYNHYIKDGEIYFIVKIITLTNIVVEGKEVYEDVYGDYYILNDDKNVLIRINDEDSKYKKVKKYSEYEEPEKIFEKMTRYSEINWEEYIKKNKSLVFLIPYAEVPFYKNYYENEDDEDRKIGEYLFNLFKEFDKYYNKETYRFAIIKKSKKSYKMRKESNEK